MAGEGVKGGRDMRSREASRSAVAEMHGPPSIADTALVRTGHLPNNEDVLCAHSGVALERLPPHSGTLPRLRSHLNANTFSGTLLIVLYGIVSMAK
ncbi:hypothetical protein BGE01nite_01020 [Brevifollis gellanilyticus]|uniref:Uncharacterized protein n=1 Tax=Brevifollis gellanilyticus TaxID=748831 RepID=A0A512M3C1_9BACT|nr:hypothetical protein BGE01nite_01020 [Brevifollis gellanilyticus]